MNQLRVTFVVVRKGNCALPLAIMCRGWYFEASRNEKL